MTSEQQGLPIVLSALLPTRQMSKAQFYEFCRTHPGLRIEQTAHGKVIVMAPAFSEMGNRNMKISAQVFNWAKAHGNGEVFDSSAGFTLPNGAQPVHRIQLGLNQIDGMPFRQTSRLLLLQSPQIL